MYYGITAPYFNVFLSNFWANHNKTWQVPDQYKIYYVKQRMQQTGGLPELLFLKLANAASVPFTYYWEGLTESDWSSRVKTTALICWTVCSDYIMCLSPDWPCVIYVTQCMITRIQYKHSESSCVLISYNFTLGMMGSRGSRERKGMPDICYCLGALLQWVAHACSESLLMSLWY